MAEPIIMPKFEMSQEIGTIVEWTKNEGDKVEKGETILVVETDKVTMDVESPESGIISGMRGKPGESIPVTEVIGYILEPGEALPAASKAEEKKSVESAEAALADSQQTVTPVAQRMAQNAGVDLSEISGTGVGGKVTKADVETAINNKTDSKETLETDAAVGKLRATPAARRLARENALELDEISGSGPRDRIQAADVQAAVSVPRAQTPPTVVESIPFSGMRKKIAERMVVSYQTAPHIYMTAKVDMSAFEDFRGRLNTRAEKIGAAHVSATTLIVKAVSWALLRNPLINSALREEKIELQADTNIGVAVALADGLIVPVVRNVEQLGLAQLAESVNELVGRARANALVPSEVTGGTFTISNLGAFGIEQFTAIINPGQTGILAVGTIQDEVVPTVEEGIAVRPIMRMTLGLDHRVADGVSGARFLADLRDALQEPELMLW